MSAQEGTGEGGCHRPSRVTRGVWGREVTAMTLSALGASFLPTLSSAAAGKEARAAPVTQPREEKQRERPSRGGTAAPTLSPGRGRDGGCERGHSASRRRPPCAQTTEELQGLIPRPSNGVTQSDPRPAAGWDTRRRDLPSDLRRRHKSLAPAGAHSSTPRS